MRSEVYKYPVLVQETHLDTFGHVNNAVYFILYEQARWDLITKNGYGIQKIKETGLGPTLLQINVRFMKELRLRESIVIETELISYEKKIGILRQTMKRGDEICSSGDFTIALFDLNARKLVLPTPDWLKAVGAIVDN